MSTTKRRATSTAPLQASRKGPLRADPAQSRPSQFTMKLSAEQHKELQRLAFDADVTMRGFVMGALKAQGLTVTNEDLVDRRKR